MASKIGPEFYAGVSWGAGITLFVVFLVCQGAGAIPGYRLVVGLAGLVLWMTGFLGWRRLAARRSPPIAGGEPTSP